MLAACVYFIVLDFITLLDEIENYVTFFTPLLLKHKWVRYIKEAF